MDDHMTNQDRTPPEPAPTDDDHWNRMAAQSEAAGRTRGGRGVPGRPQGARHRPGRPVMSDQRYDDKRHLIADWKAPGLVAGLTAWLAGLRSKRSPAPHLTRSELERIVSGVMSACLGFDEATWGDLAAEVVDTLHDLAALPMADEEPDERVKARGGPS